MKTKYICANCAHEEPRWLGRCPSCGQYNSLEEVTIKPNLPGGAGAAQRTSTATPATKTQTKTPTTPKPQTTKATLLKNISITGETGNRHPTNISELDRVLGGGIVPGSILLLGGDPGIGKSTLLLQVCQHMANDNFRILYATGEESESQIKMRADRLQVTAPGCYLLAETDIHTIRDAAQEIKPALLIIDSIQTMRFAELTSLPGSVTQVRECAAFFTVLAKQQNMAAVLVGHVTKEGSLAGPRVLEHMVDTVLYFEGEGKDACRVIRAVKNRFGSTAEIGVFEMGEEGLQEILDPSAYMLSGRPVGASGSIVTCTMEGTRPLLAEVQALVAHTNFGTPRRTSIGMDYNRVVMLLAVLEKRAGYKLQNYDAYVNAAGGIKLTEPAADAGIVAALASCYKNKPIESRLLVFGEVGLAGELRAVSHAQRRITEAARQGFTSCVMPYANKKKLTTPEGFRIFAAANVSEMLEAIIS